MLNVDHISSESIIGKFRKVSPAVEDYMLREMYLYDAEVVENVSVSFVQSKCLDILLDELLSMGIILDMSMENIIDNTEVLNVIAIVRDMMSTNSLNELLKQCDLSSLDELESMLVPFKDDDHPSGILIALFIERMESWHPTNVNWSLLCHWSDAIVSTSRFIDHISAILTSIRSNGNPSVLNDANTELVVNYITHLHNEKNLFTSLVKQIMASDASLDRIYLLKEAEHYNIDLSINHDILILARKQNNDDMSDDEIIHYETIIKRHKIKNPHHLEHFISRKSKVTREEMILLVCANVEKDCQKHDVIDIINRLVVDGGDLLDKQYMLSIVDHIQFNNTTT